MQSDEWGSFYSHFRLSTFRDLTKRYKDETFIVDRNDSQTFTKFNLATIGALLDDREATRRLRR